MKRSVFDNLLAEIYAVSPIFRDDKNSHFIELQRLECAIIDKYNAGIISDREKRALLLVVLVLEDEYRKEEKIK